MRVSQQSPVRVTTVRLRPSGAVRRTHRHRAIASVSPTPYKLSCGTGSTGPRTRRTRDQAFIQLPARQAGRARLEELEERRWHDGPRVDGSEAARGGVDEDTAVLDHAHLPAEELVRARQRVEQMQRALVQCCLGRRPGWNGGRRRCL